MRKFKIDLTDQNLFRRISIRLYTKCEIAIDGRLTMIILDAICEGAKVFCKTSNKIMHIDPYNGYTIYVYYYRGLKVEIHDAHNRIPKDKLPESIKNYVLSYVSDSDYSKYEIIKAAYEILDNKYGKKFQIPTNIIFDIIYETVFCMIEDVYTKYFCLDDIRNRYDSILFTYRYVENAPEVYSHIFEETGENVEMENHFTKFVNIVFPEIKLPSELLEYKL